ncbi:MAG: type II CAAX prenyl endopeptidase Rce1 family protein [Fluviicola sp.]|jgi:membrane protease YdiL (CAAX protease family)
MTKRKVYAMGGITLLMAPLGWILAGFPPIIEFLDFDNFNLFWTLIGIQFGFICGIIMYFLGNLGESPKMDEILKVVQSMKLSIIDCVFISFCAGFGEECLFRAGIQPWLTPIPTALLFVAIHGYLNPKKPDIIPYGILVLLFIIALSYGMNSFGLWFSIAAHFSYDFVLFYFWRKSD